MDLITLQKKITALFENKFEEAAVAATKAIAEVAEEAQVEVAEAVSAPTSAYAAFSPKVFPPVQVTVRKGNTLHFQAGSTSSYNKGDVYNPALAGVVAAQAFKGNGNVNTSFAGSSTLYVKVKPTSTTSGVLPDGTAVPLPSGLLQ